MGTENRFIPHPIPYQGSKRNLAGRILDFFPKDAKRLVEPFAGSASVSIAAISSQRVTSVVLGDADAALIHLWTDILNKPEELADSYEFLWTAQLGWERDYYDTVRAQFNKTHRSDHFLYLLARCVKAAVRYNTSGEFNQSPDNRRKGTRPETVRKHLLAASHLLAKHTNLMCEDYRKTLALACSDDIIYLDPPYQGVSQNRDPRYKGKVTFDDFVEVLNNLNARQLSYIVSYDGKTGGKSHGKLLPAELNLAYLEIPAGRSAQATLLGRKVSTVESLYLSPALLNRLKVSPPNSYTLNPTQLDLFPSLANV